MNDEPSFLAFIREYPWDDVVREVYADWLDEHGQPEKARYLRLLAAFHTLLTLAAFEWKRPRDYEALLEEVWEARQPLDTSWVLAVTERPKLIAPREAPREKNSLLLGLWNLIIEG